MLLDEQEEYCFDCRRRHHRYDEGFSIFPYDALMQRSMIYFKFHGRREYGKFYGEMILRCARQTVARWNPEVLIPVPIHRSKRRQRGYNQSEIIGCVLSKGFSIPIRSDLVKRVKSTKAQKELNNRERKRNLQGAFTAANEISRYRRVLLVDDIYTTGSTVDELAGVLKKHGVEQVFFVTVCIGKGY